MTTANKAIIGAIVIAGFIFFSNSAENENKGLTNEQADVIMKRDLIGVPSSKLPVQENSLALHLASSQGGWY